MYPVIWKIYLWYCSAMFWGHSDVQSFTETLFLTKYLCTEIHILICNFALVHWGGALPKSTDGIWHLEKGDKTWRGSKASGEEKKEKEV